MISERVLGGDDAEVAFYGLLDDVGAAAAELAGRLTEGDGVSNSKARRNLLVGETGTYSVPSCITVNDISQQVTGCT